MPMCFESVLKKFCCHCIVLVSSTTKHLHSVDTTLPLCKMLLNYDLWPYIFILSFVLSFFFFLSSPNLSGRRLDVHYTCTHGVALVRI